MLSCHFKLNGDFFFKFSNVKLQLKFSVSAGRGEAKGHCAICFNVFYFLICHSASQVALVVKNSPTNAGDIRDPGSIPGLGRSPGEGNGSLLQHSCLGNLMDGEPGGLQSTQSQRVGHNLATKQQDHQETLYFCFLPCLSSV